jgi:hypothetical protein
MMIGAVSQSIPAGSLKSAKSCSIPSRLAFHKETADSYVLGRSDTAALFEEAGVFEAL